MFVLTLSFSSWCPPLCSIQNVKLWNSNLAQNQTKMQSNTKISHQLCILQLINDEEWVFQSIGLSEDATPVAKWCFNLLKTNLISYSSVLIIITIHAKDIIAECIWSPHYKQSSQTALLYLSLPIKLFIKERPCLGLWGVYVCKCIYVCTVCVWEILASTCFCV